MSTAPPWRAPLDPDAADRALRALDPRLRVARPGDGRASETNGRRGELPPPLFSSTVNRGCVDLPWADFSFYMPRKSHKLRTPPWSVLQPRMMRQSAGVRWEDKIELAMHTGNVGSPYRKKLAAVAKDNADTMLVNELFIGDHGKITKTCHQIGRERKGGYQKHLCYMTFTEQCSYKRGRRSKRRPPS